MPGAEVHPADLADPEAAVRAAQGADVIFYTVGLPYPLFRLHPALAQNAVAAAEVVGARAVLVTSVYSYGRPRTQPVAEDHPREPQAFKGRMRKEQEDVFLQAHRQGRVPTLVARLPDFYGPWADRSFGNLALRSALSGRPATWLGPLDVPHEFVYVPDAARAVVELALEDDTYGQPWNVPGPGPITGHEWLTIAYQQAGHRPRWRTVGPTGLRLAGLFVPFLRELVELYYLFETPPILDARKLRARLPAWRPTPYAEGIRQTVGWMRLHPSPDILARR